MARIRTIKPEFWVDDDMVELPILARLLFIGLWNFVDDWGLIEYKPKRIKMQVFPADNLDVLPLIESLIESGRLRVISSDQGDLLYVVNWTRHQVINRPTDSRFTGLSEPISVSAHGVLSESSVRKGKERKGKERIHGESKSIPIPSDWSPTPEHVELGRTLRVDVPRQAELFRLHAETHDRRAVRWNAAFTTWLKKSPQTAAASRPVTPENEWMFNR